MLWKLLVEYLRPQRRLLLAVVVFQLAASIASLYLPTLNADIIDQGVATGDTELHPAHRRHDAVGHPAAGRLHHRRPCTSARRPRWRWAGTSAGAIFSRVAAFSEQEVTRFGPPSLITRSTNDVQQVQQLVLMSATLMVTAPMLCIGGVIMAIRQDVQLSWLIAVSVPVLLAAVGSIIMPDGAAVPADAGPDRHRQPGAARTAHRHPRGAGLRPGGRGDRPLCPRQRGRHGHRAARRPAHGARVPHRDAGAQRLQHGRDLVRRVPDRGRVHAGGHHDRVPELPDADPDVRHDGHVHGDHDPARRRLRRTGSARCSGPNPASGRRCTRFRARPARAAAWRAGDARRRIRLPGCRAAGALAT